MTYKDLVRKLQAELNRLGESLTVDGDPGPKTQAALAKYDVNLVAAPTPKEEIPVKEGATHLHPLDWARRELGQKEVAGSKDNPRIRWYHTHCANIGSKEHPDEVPWCSSFVNAAADECGMEKTDNALAASWKKYGEDSGDEVEAGDIVCIGSSHVTLANKAFNRKKDKTFEGLGGNQGNQVKVSNYSTSSISTCRKWKAKPGTVSSPIGTKAPPASADGDQESTR